MTYREVTEEILGKRRFGNLFGVEIWQRMSDMLHNPQEGMRLIHIAGTNGKGSVAAFLCAILREAGIKTGLFTSPHLVDFETRLMKSVRLDTVQLVVISRPSAYGEYEPYSFADTEQEFETVVKNM